MARTAEEIRAAAKAARERATQVLTPEQVELAAALAEEAEAKEAEAAEQAKLRALDMAARLEAAETKAGGEYLVAGVDLVALFPFGKAPAKLPGDGVIIVRSPSADASDAFARDIEAKKKNLSAMAAELSIACTVDPDPMSVAGVALGAFYAKYPEATGTIAQRARELGGAKTTADKRGRT